MPPRKAPPPLAPAVKVEVVPVDPDAGVTHADHRAASAMMLRALAGLDPVVALDRLRALYASLPNGTARRAVLAARLSILRDDLPQRITPVAPPPVAAPVVTKAPPKAGALSTLALDAAARLLMEAGGEEDAPPPTRAPKAAPPVADLFAALAAAEDEDPETEVALAPPSPDPAPPLADPPVETDVSAPLPAAEIPADSDPAPAAAAARAKSKPRKAKPVALDPATIAALMDDGATEPSAEAATEPSFVPTPPQVMASALSMLSALGAEDADNDAPATGEGVPPRGAAGLDLGAAFAALADSDDAPVAPPSDMRLTDALSALDQWDDLARTSVSSIQPAPPPVGRPEDDIAASLSALIGEGDEPTAPAMPEAEVSDRLTALDPATAPRPKPRRAKPTDLSDVSAAFAAMTDDPAD